MASRRLVRSFADSEDPPGAPLQEANGLLYLVAQIRTTVKSTVGWRPGDVREWLPEVVPGEQPHQDEIGPESSKSGAGKSDLHLAAELGGKYEALGPKGFQEIGSAPESRPEVARPPKVTLRRPDPVSWWFLKQRLSLPMVR
jgi:hypothetical protein